MENNKPITLVREDFIANVVTLMNQSNLPAFVVEDILRQLLNYVSEIARQQLEHDRQEYAIATAQIESTQTKVEETDNEQ